MTERTSAPDLDRIAGIPTNRWTEPFWQAAARCELVLPRCASCETFRWPPGPFCPNCRSQEVVWSDAGRGLLYSYTLLRQSDPSPDGPPRIVAPGLVEFPESGGLRIVAAIVDSNVDAIRIGAPLTLGWVPKDETHVPVFSIG